ncbi:MAG: GGDEF domain-containing protein [Acidobacteriota bacterium]
MPRAHPPQRAWIRFLSQLLAGDSSAAADLDQALDMVVAFSRCRAAALFAPRAAGGLGVRASSAVLRQRRADLEAILGANLDGAALEPLITRTPSLWPLVEIADQLELMPLRGLALALETLAVSIYPAAERSVHSGLTMFLWEDTPDSGQQDRAELAGMALCAGLEAPDAFRAAPCAPAPEPVLITGAAAESRQAQRRVLSELERMARLAPQDPLSGLARHSSLLSALETAVAHASNSEEPLALILIDTDDLAGINRAHGPEAGDDVLRGIASIVLEETGGEDLAVRYGMEEFALLVRGSPQQVRQKAQAIQRKVQQRAFPGPAGSQGGSISVGIGCLPDPLAADTATLRLKAEQALDLACQQRPGGLILL